MRLAATLLLGLVALTGCSLGSPASSSSPATSPTASACPRLPVSAPVADGPPVAILKDVASGPREFLLGSPGGVLTRIAEATGMSPPRLGGGRVFLSVGPDLPSQEIRVARPGECSAHLANGTMSEVEAQGRGLVVNDGTHTRMLDGAGRPIVDVGLPGGTWTSGGNLAVPTAASGLKVYDLSGAARDINLPAGSTPNGPLGASQELITTPAGVQTVDVRDGKLQPLPQPVSAQRLLSGSPDGNYVALIDAQGTPEVVDMRDGHITKLPIPGPSLGALWQSSSQWVAIVSLYGGAVVRVADDRVIDTGPLNVVSW